jgi:putative intracellular protease/amidase
MIRVMLTLLALAATPVTAPSDAPAASERLQPPAGRDIRVAFALSDGAVMIDFAGPWEVFQDVMLKGAAHEMPFELYTVAASRKPVHTSGGMKPGMTVIPDYSFADAPPPDVVVVGAQSGGEGLSAWLQKVHGDHALIMSVCTGAYRLAASGLLKGKTATTHHDSLQRFANQYPDVTVTSAVRYVQSDSRLITAGGLSSGIDAALHVVALYFGPEVAQATADEMEYQGQGWRTNSGHGEQRRVMPTIPLAYRDRATLWRGVFLPAYPHPKPELSVLMHLVQVDGRYRATIDAPTAGLLGEPLDIQIDQGNVGFTVDSDHGPRTFSGAMSADTIAGQVTGAGMTPTPLTLRKSAE